MFIHAKRVAFLLAALIFVAAAALIPGKKASAEETQYLRVLSGDAYIYEDPALKNKIFAVKNGYFVSVVQDLGSYVRVSYGYENENYPVIYGYMSASDLTKVNESPVTPYTVLKLDVNYTEVLFSSIDLSRACFNLVKGSTVYFYGYAGDRLCYVYAEQKLGYIDAAAFDKFTVPENEQVTTVFGVTPGDEPSAEVTDKTDSGNTANFKLGESVQIIIIVGISVISISIVYVLFKPTRNKVSERDEFKDD